MNFTILNRDSNEAIDEIISFIPKYSKQNRVLTFTFVDPYSLNLNFKTIERLSQLKMDFLILLAFHMDANRNFQTYYEAENHKIENFLDKKNWRDNLKEGYLKDAKSFVQFLGESYRDNMKQLQYISTDTFVHIHSDKKNLPLYYLAYFSKDKLGSKFWKEVQKYSDPQIELF
jgi:three-Cys-motif partner protein